LISAFWAAVATYLISQDTTKMCN